MKFIPNAVSTRAARTILVSQKSSPKVLFAVGIVGFGATVVLACRGTLKLESILDGHEENIQKVDPNSSKDKARVYLTTVGDLGKAYGPAIICGAVAIGALAGSHNILNKRNAALAAAYGTIERAYSEYRERVRAELGEKRELELYRNVQQVEEKDDKGKVTKVKQIMADGSPYSFFFDEFNRNYESTPEYNFTYLKLQQQYANHQLQARGHLFLNDVLRALGFEDTKAGAVTGWVKGQGDDFVDFGIFQDDMSERLLDFMTGREKGIWLSFNVDGVIYDKI
jgi:hypothetical protein